MALGRDARLLAAALVSGVLGCASTAPVKERDRSGAGDPWTECYSAFVPSGNARADLARLTRACGPLGGMHAVTPVRMDEQSAADPVDRYTFFVGQAGRCYRVYAVGGRGVEDLDLLLRGPEGDSVIGDLGHDPHPIVPPQGPICFDAPGLYQLEVSVFRGSGRYAVQVWGT